MTTKTKYLSALLFAFFIIIANYGVTIQINQWLNYGMLIYPFTFLLTDILSEKYTKQDTLNIVKLGSFLAIIPTIYMAGWLIAIASITTFILIQQFDVQIFHYLKQKMEKAWWIRNNVSTIVSQLFDTVLFYALAFYILPSIATMIFGASSEWFFMSSSEIIKYTTTDYSIKVILAILDTPLFYLFAIRVKQATIKIK
jgi:uncharacterized PurR-regulated membrane protein YhhQ (DUF165 family)